MKRAATLAAVALVAACVAPPAADPDGAEPAGAAPTGPPPAAAPALPEGFEVKGEPEVLPADLDPAATWRFLQSHLTTLRAEAGARVEDLLVSFEADRFHVTDRSGRRRTWRLPAGLELGGVPSHLVIRADLTCDVYDAAGAQMPRGDEVTVVTARLEEAAGTVQEIRLLVKGGRVFRSISTAG